MDDILDRWGDIAKELRCTVQTAIRYSKFKKKPLPVTYDPAGHPVITKEQCREWRTGKAA
ncbi:MAG: hypothetical protein ABFD76_14905 [Smithella sp.]